MSLQYKGDGIYQDPRTDNLYHRPTVGGRRTARKLNATTLTMARREMAVMKTRQLESRLGVALDPYATLVTVGQIAKEWIARNCPDRAGIPRKSESLKSEKGRVTKLLDFWKDREARAINAEDCRDYHAWRVKRNKLRYTLGRVVDAELTTLSNLLTWAAQNTRKTGLHINPLAAGRPRFNNLAQVRHCTAVMPMTDEAMHQLAGYLLASDQSRPLGWQLLLEALTGARTSEILACRMGADKPRESGYQDGHALHLNRRKKGIEPWALLEVIPKCSPLADCLAAFRHWHATRYRKCPWFIPGREGNKPINADSLTHALRRACKELKLPLVTSHGIRAYYVRTLRSLGIDDSEIAKRLGHRSGVALVEKTYGISEPGWFGSKKMDFVPEEFPAAWTPWTPPRSKKIVDIADLAAYQRHTTNGKTGSNPVKSAPAGGNQKRPSILVKPGQVRKDQARSATP